MPDNSQTNTVISNSAGAPVGGDAGAVSDGAPANAGAVTGLPSPTEDPNAGGGADAAGADNQDQNMIANANAIMQETASKINDAHNILVALSSDPSVDDLAGAIGLSLYLDKLGKRATAIYSGATPNALEFLKPEENFDTTTDTLQDFVIALNKDKADHLRYKLDGDYVKIFITPYRARIAEEDLEFSYGDYNVDLVLALDVANGTDLDSALREHGRIMHDATIINITNGNPGKFGELEWSNKHASSICEMLTELVTFMSGKNPVGEEAATALLTGIVAATDRFSEANTTPDTMRVASKLMESGANQQLIAQNIENLGNQTFEFTAPSAAAEPTDPTALEIEHEEGDDDSSGGADGGAESVTAEAAAEPAAAGSVVIPAPESVLTPAEPAVAGADLAPVGAGVTPAPADNSDALAAVAAASDSATPAAPVEDNSADLLSDLKAAEASLTNAGAETTPEAVQEPIRLDGGDEFKPEKIITPPEDFAADPTSAGDNKYGQMLEDALAEANAAATPVVQDPAMAAPIVSDMNAVPAMGAVAAPEPVAMPAVAAVSEPVAAAPGLAPAPDFVSAPELAPNPAASIAPPVASAPEVNGVPEINYMPMPEDQVLPPPPTPPVDFDSPMPSAPEGAATDMAGAAPVEASVAAPEPGLGAQPVMPDAQAAAPAAPVGASDPGAFKIPGM